MPTLPSRSTRRQVHDASSPSRPSHDASATFALPQSPWPLGDGFFPLGLLVAAPTEHSWTREGGLAAARVRRSCDDHDRVVRVAAGQGFWGDWLEAPVRQVRGGPIDYLMMDYLAEVTMSIMQKQKSRDPEGGLRAGFRSAHGADPPGRGREGDQGHLQRRRRESARVRRGGARGRPAGWGSTAR